jgi:hypothetical protein
MRCAHPMCQRGIGLVSHRRGWFGKRLYCSRACRDNYAAELRQPRQPAPRRSSFEPSLFELLVAPGRSPAMAMSYAAASRKLARLGMIAGFGLTAMLLLVDPGSAGHSFSARGATGIGTAPQGHQGLPSARRCDPPPCPMRGNAAPFRR